MKKIFRLVPLATLAAPLSAVAQAGTPNLEVVRPYSNAVISFINTILVPVLLAVAFIVFLWGIFKYFIYGATNESEKAEGRKFALWGIIGFVVIFVLWGLVALVMGVLGFSAASTIPAPKPPTI